MVFNKAVESLLELYWGKVDVQPKMHKYCLVEDGFYVDPKSGVLMGRHLDLDLNTMGHYSPLYYYNRSWRFIGLFSVFTYRA